MTKDNMKKQKELFSVVWQRHKSKYLMILPFGLLFVLYFLSSVYTSNSFFHN